MRGVQIAARWAATVCRSSTGEVFGRDDKKRELNRRAPLSTQTSLSTRSSLNDVHADRRRPLLNDEAQAPEEVLERVDLARDTRPYDPSKDDKIMTGK